MLSHERELKEPFVKLAMAFEVGGWSDPQLVSVCVLQQLLGGGSSFSAGGPGKGMFTRLYLHVLNRNYWTESVEAFMSIHERSGLLGIDGACPPDKLVNLIQVPIFQLNAPYPGFLQYIGSPFLVRLD
jgi:processing peptidase subunit alpha